MTPLLRPTGPILVTGGSGQLAQCLARLGAPRVRVAGRPELDFDRPDSIDACFAAVAPALVVNAAAWTAVDAAEANAAAAMRANCDGPARLAALCAAAGVPLIHVSTDYVFDGSKGAPYTEDDATNPTGIYGETKLAGEQAVLAAWPCATILRTSWVYAAIGKNFVRTMLGAAARTNHLRVVADQIGCPTRADDLAEAILSVVAMIEAGWQPDYAGIFHAAGQGYTSWHGLACAVFQEAARHGLTPPEVIPITTADWPTPARRPADSRLDCGKLQRVFGVALPPWQYSVAATVATLMQNAAEARA